MQIHPTEQNENTSDPTKRRKDPLGGPDNRTTVEVTEEAGGRSQQAQASGGGGGADHRACAELSVNRVSPAYVCVLCVPFSEMGKEPPAWSTHTKKQTEASLSFLSIGDV